MANVTALLVVLTLAGEPAANALCISWCDLQSETQSCGEAIAQTAAPELTVTVLQCVLTPGVTPFLKEEGKDRIAAAVDVLPTSGPVPSEGAVLLHLHSRGDTVAGRPAPLLVLRV